jgi:hypothetical protein
MHCPGTGARFSHIGLGSSLKVSACVACVLVDSFSEFRGAAVLGFMSCVCPHTPFFALVALFLAFKN